MKHYYIYSDSYWDNDVYYVYAGTDDEADILANGGRRVTRKEAERTLRQQWRLTSNIMQYMCANTLVRCIKSFCEDPEKRLLAAALRNDLRLACSEARRAESAIK